MRRLNFQLMLILPALWALSGCVSYPALTAEQLKGPVVEVQQNKLAPSQSLACAQIKSLQIPVADYKKAAQEGGILADDLLSLQQTTRTEKIIISIRDVNKSCAPYLQEGYASKGHDVLTKTFTKESLPPEYQYLAGTISTLAEKPKAGERIRNPLSKQYLTKDGNMLTCDYDLMDVAWADGQRVKGESAEDLRLRKKLNDNLPKRGEPPVSVPRFMHGAQAEYSNYLRAVADKQKPEQPILQLNKPEAPLTALTHKGEIYYLPQIEDALNFYNCYNISLPKEWDIEY